MLKISFSRIVYHRTKFGGDQITPKSEFIWLRGEYVFELVAITRIRVDGEIDWNYTFGVGRRYPDWISCFETVVARGKPNFDPKPQPKTRKWQFLSVKNRKNRFWNLEEWMREHRNKRLRWIFWQGKIKNYWGTIIITVLRIIIRVW